MKFLFAVWFLSAGFFSHAQSGGSFAGEWAWIASGCRDSDLSAASHVSKAKSQNPEDIEAGDFFLGRGGSARMTYTQDGREQSFSGSYDVRGGQLIISGSLTAGHGFDFILEIVDGSLMVARNEGDFREPGMEDFLQRLRDVCGRGKAFVYILGRVGAAE